MMGANMIASLGLGLCIRTGLGMNADRVVIIFSSRYLDIRSYPSKFLNLAMAITSLIEIFDIVDII